MKRVRCFVFYNGFGLVVHVEATDAVLIVKSTWGNHDPFLKIKMNVHSTTANLNLN